MMLMVSVQNVDEALEALRGGADIVDVKNLEEALVGSAHPRDVQAVREATPMDRHASVTLGVVPDQVGTVAMAVHAAGTLRATSVKVGFMRTSYEAAVETLRASRMALDGFDTLLIGSLFADNELFDGLDARMMNRLARDGECDGWLIDTLSKDGRNLFDFIDEAELREMVLEGKESGMSTALSGHLRIADLDALARINPDIVGVRGAACRKGVRTTGIDAEAVAGFKRQLDLRRAGEVEVHASNRLAPSAVAGSAVERTNAASVAAGNGWVVLDGTGKSCKGILAALTAQFDAEDASVVEVIIPDVLTTYDVIGWAEKRNHDILAQREHPAGGTRILIRR